MRRAAARFSPLGAFSPLLAPGQALACAACLSGDGGAAAAYVGTAALLALLPFALIGGIGWWCSRRARRTRP